MTLGEKIRKYRLLKGLKQQELGEAVGFKKSTADVRINQYESNKMAPKADIRQAIANALDIDMGAVSDISITSYEDMMHIFFEFEEKLGMKVIKENGTTSLLFDDNNKEISTLISYMNLWQTQRAAMGIDNENVSDDVIREYKMWQGKFKSHVENYYQIKKEEIDQFYQKSVDNLSGQKYALTTSEITLLLRELIESGLTVSTDNLILGIGDIAPGFTFVTGELINPPTEKAKALFARFLYEYNHFGELGAETFIDLQMIGKYLTITYYVRASSFSVITSQVNTFLEYKEKESMQGDFFKDSFEMSFKSDLDTSYNIIADEIRHKNP